MDKVESGIAAAAKALTPTREGFVNFARAIMTTDTREKIAWRRGGSGAGTFRIAGCAKGSGMIDPRMATMLAFVVTDAKVSPERLDFIFRDAIERSLNCVTVDGDTSTNDTAIVLASGASGADVDSDTATQAEFAGALTALLQSLARQIAFDGEGATKLVEVTVSGASSFEDARDFARSVANSNLVKTAIYGRDANWGRICCAIGNAPVRVNPHQVAVRLGGITLYENGAPLPFDEALALEVLSQEFVAIAVEAGMGSESATVWTCDLTEKYIEINGSYRT